MNENPNENDEIISAIVDAIGSSRRELLMNTRSDQMRALLAARLQKTTASESIAERMAEQNTVWEHQQVSATIFLSETEIDNLASRANMTRDQYLEAIATAF